MKYNFSVPCLLLIFLGISFLFPNVAAAQDLVFFHDSTVVEARVMEVKERVVVYARRDAMDSVKQYTINKRSIAAIRFENGQQVTFGAKSQPLGVVTAVSGMEQQRTDNQQVSNQQNNDNGFIVPPSKEKNPRGGFSFKIGATLPLGALSKGAEALAFGENRMTSLDNAAFGYAVGVDLDVPLSDFGLGIFVGLDVMFLPLKQSARVQRSEEFSQEVVNVWMSPYVQGFNSNDFQSGYVKNPIYLNIPLMAGVRYAYPLSEKHRLFVDVGIGCNLLNTTTLEAEATFDFSGEPAFLRERYHWKEVMLSFGYKAGVGVVLWNHWTLDFHFQGVNKGEMGYKYQRVTPAHGEEHPQRGAVKVGNYQLLTFSMGYKL